MYHYEALGDERFQEFCQALLSATFPNVQCLPVGQPDGGRDAFIQPRLLIRNTEAAQRELVVFQVKYIRNPMDTRSERDLIEQVIKSEKEKIDRLRPRGLSKYYLLTNLRGTSHLDVGSIDRINALLSKELNIEAYCWWKDDLDRRLDLNANLKWSYPDVLKATDLLGKLVEGQLGEDEERRRSAIRAYLIDQYKDDQELKFKQTELRSTMTDLFVDLPMSPSPELQDAPEGVRRHHLFRPFGLTHFQYVHYAYEEQLSASYFINHMPRSGSNRIVLEGAPGQGKSTVTQYVCQVMRMQLLDMTDALTVLPDNHRHAQIRIPFRVDLRDLAKWLAGLDPFQPKLVQLDEREPRSLEGLLAGQVRHSSGGHSFSVSDLTAVAKASHIFLALDGFDEVADVESRQRLVDEISKGTNRLSNAGGYSVHTIVTSRPVAFAKSVRFPRDQWDYFELLPLERRQVDEYTTKWMRAKGLKDTEQNQLRRLLDTKLREAHTQYLAKNPMQLTILLSLIHNRGASLPEKRTAMYDAYMDMFFSRESEKSDVVRDYRDILIDIHRYLAWKLQTAAEAGGDGSIEYGELRATLFSYLDSEGEDTSIVNDLFNGIIERVGALVSRVQDTYEFEVQPLREYFAARFLYDTAPYPSGDTEPRGDKFDRFNALIRNPYWLNVARFYGGCFNKGEILTLVNELMQLGELPPYVHTSHPRLIALMLLGDWVFTQYQPAVRNVVSFITEYPQLRQLLATVDEPGANLWGVLPDRSGRMDFLAVLFALVVRTKHVDERRAIARIIIQNTATDERFLYWQQAEKEMKHTDWTKLGGALDLYAKIGKSEAESLLSRNSDEMLVRFVEARCFDLLQKSMFAGEARASVLNQVLFTNVPFEGTKLNGLSWLAMICGTYQYGVVFQYSGRTPLRAVVEGRAGRSAFPSKSIIAESLKPGDLPEADQRAIATYLAFVDNDVEALSSSLSPWKELVSAMRMAWGDSSAVDRIAFLSAGIRSKVDLGIDGDLGPKDDIVESVRFARLRSGSPQWWRNRLTQCADAGTSKRWLLIYWLWATPRTLIKLSSDLDSMLLKLSYDSWINLSREFYVLSQFLKKPDVGPLRSSDVENLKSLSTRARSFVGQRLNSLDQFDLAISMWADDSAEAPQIQFSMEAIVQFCQENGRWGDSLDKIESLYLRGATIPLNMRNNFNLSESIALHVARAPERFPLPLVATADSALRSSAGAEASRLLTVASRDKWFH